MARYGSICCTSRSLLLFTLTMAFASRLASAITFDLPQGERKCFTEDLPPSTDIRGDIHVAGGQGEMRLDLFVSDAKGGVVFHKTDVDMVKFSFRTGSFDRYSTARYRFCIVNQVHPHAQPPSGNLVRRVTMKIDVLHQAKSDIMGRLATKGHLSKLQDSFHTVSNDVDRIIEAMDELRAKEQELTDLNRETTRTIVRISLIACFFTVATGALNVMSLKSFFKQKKLA